MPNIERSALVPYSAQQMYQLVNDIEAYSEFLPWCSAARILEDSEVVRVARVDISKGPIKQFFVTRNTLVENEAIELSLVEGPFSALNGEWQFKDIGDAGCRVTFTIDFSFSNFLMQKTLGPLFDEICSRMVDAFVARARNVYP